jgi:hypothetical protein
VPGQPWNCLIDGAVDCIDVLVYAGLFLVDGHPDLAATLATKAAHGKRTRMMFGDPDSAMVAERGEEEGIGEDLAARIRLSLANLREVLGVPGIQVCQHDTILYN